MYKEWGGEPAADVFVAADFGYKKPQRTANAWHMLADFPSGEIRMN